MINKGDLNNSTRNYSQLVEKVIDDAILSADKQGFHRCIFPCDPYSYVSVIIDGERVLLDGAEYFEDMKTKYELNGYKIVPTGIVGGVRQLSYDIYW